MNPKTGVPTLLLDRYLADDLSKTEKKQFEKLLADDADVRTQLQTRSSERERFVAAENPEQFAEKILNNMANRKTNATRFAWFYWLKFAAPITVMATAVIIFKGTDWLRENHPEPTLANNVTESVLQEPKTPLPQADLVGKAGHYETQSLHDKKTTIESRKKAPTPADKTKQEITANKFLAAEAPMRNRAFADKETLGAVDKKPQEGMFGATVTSAAPKAESALAEKSALTKSVPANQQRIAIEVDGTLSATQIHEHISQKNYLEPIEKILRSSRQQHSLMRVELRVNAAGHVEQVTVLETNHVNSLYQQRLKTLLLDWRFPTSAGTTVVRMTLKP